MAKAIDFGKLLDEVMAEMHSPSVIKQLVAKDVSDHARGKIEGKIEMVQHMMRKCAALEAENQANENKQKNEQSKKNQKGTGNRVSHES